MIPQVTTAAVSRRVAHLEAVKRQLSITDTSEDSNLLEAIDFVSGEYVRIMGREPWMQSYLVEQPGDGGTFLRLPVWPLISVSQVRTGGRDNWETVTASEYEIAEDASRRDQLYRKLGWPQAAYPRRMTTSADARAMLVETTCVAGWATPIDEWAADTVVRLGEWARSTSQLPNNSLPELRFEATAVAGAGQTDSSEPAEFATASAGDEITDNDITWTARTALEMPANLWGAAMWSTKAIFRQPELAMGLPAGIEELSGGGMKIKAGRGGGMASGSFLPAVSLAQVEHYA